MEAFDRLVEIVRQLRRDCPWDRAQTHRSLVQNLIEESYEVAEAIEETDHANLREELGDLLLQVVLHAVIGRESKAFDIDSVCEGISDKLVRRHPHVFGDTTAHSPGEAITNWERLKRAEGKSSVLDGVPKSLPALLRACRLQQKAARVGFDWERSEEVMEKVQEELGELRDSLAAKDTDAVEEELGDLLFSMVNFARFVDVDPEQALRRTIRKFITRFQQVEQELRARGIAPQDAPLEEMDRIWEATKGNSK